MPRLASARLRKGDKELLSEDRTLVLIAEPKNRTLVLWLSEETDTARWYFEGIKNQEILVQAKTARWLCYIYISEQTSKIQPTRKPWLKMVFFARNRAREKTYLMLSAFFNKFFYTLIFFWFRAARGKPFFLIFFCVFESIYEQELVIFFRGFYGYYKR